MDPRTSGGSEDMTVNGSVTPVSFRFAPPAGEIWYVVNTTFLIDDTGINSLTRFGALNSLTNGVLFRTSINGTVYLMATLQENQDLLGEFPDHTLSPSGLFTNLLAGGVEFEIPIKLVGDDGDYIEFLVQDNLTQIVNFYCHYKAYKEIT